MEKSLNYDEQFNQTLLRKIQEELYHLGNASIQEDSIPGSPPDVLAKINPGNLKYLVESLQVNEKEEAFI
ncbi:MAG: hypothetical protein QNK11_07500 [Legionella sp.]|nr:hypothetical protein [Legionella sp.]